VAEDFAGGGVDDSQVVAVDESDDAGSVEGSSEGDVVELSVDAHGDPARVDTVVADAELAVGLLGGTGAPAPRRLPTGSGRPSD